MSIFEECTSNTITNNGELINGRLVYSLLGNYENKPVYFGLKDDTTWVGKLSTKGTSAFYLTSDTNGCTAEVKDSTTSPTTADANTAREIWLNIPKATSSRKIIFSYNGITVLTINLNVTKTRGICHIIKVTVENNLYTTRYPFYCYLTTNLVTNTNFFSTINHTQISPVYFSSDAVLLYLYNNDDFLGYSDDVFERIYTEGEMDFLSGNDLYNQTYNSMSLKQAQLIDGNENIYNVITGEPVNFKSYITNDNEHSYKIYMYILLLFNSTETSINYYGYFSSRDKGVYSYAV